MSVTYNNFGLTSSQNEDTVQLTPNPNRIFQDLKNRWSQLTKFQIAVCLCIVLGILNGILLVYVSTVPINSGLRLTCAQDEPIEGYFNRFVYPKVRRNDGSSGDIFHGIEIKDPYRWLEKNSTETSQFVKIQNKMTHAFLGPSRIGRKNCWNKIREEIENVWETPWNKIPQKIGNKYFSFYRVPAKVSSIDRSLPHDYFNTVRYSLNGTEEVILDQVKEGIQPKSHIQNMAYSSNGDIIAYKYKVADIPDSNFVQIKIQFLNVTSKTHLPDTLLTSYDTVTGELKFTADDKGLYYMKQTPSPAFGLKEKGKFTIFFHRLGTSQNEDVIVRDVELPDYTSPGISVQYSKKLDYMTMLTYGKKTELYLLPLSKPEGELVLLTLSNSFLLYRYLDDDQDGTFLFHEEEVQKSKARLIKVDVRNAETFPENGRLTAMATEFVKDPPARGVLTIASVVDGNKLILVYHDTTWKIIVELRNLASGALLKTLNNFDLGRISSLTSGRDSDEIFLYHESFVAATIFHCQIKRDVIDIECKIFNRTTILGIDPDNFVHEEVLYPSTDGLMRPLDIVMRKNITLDGTNPVLLETRSLKYGFRDGLVFAQNTNGIYAFIQHSSRAGMSRTKKMFQHEYWVGDMQAAAEYLIKNNYTSSSKLAIQGGWAAAACVNQRPELYGAAIVKHGENDLLRIHLACEYCDSYGTPEEKSNFESLLKYSPLHNIRLANGTQYPSILVLTRNGKEYWGYPGHSYKYIAELQYTIGRHPSQTNPLLLDVDTRDELPFPNVKERIDVSSFLAETIGLQFQNC